MSDEFQDAYEWASNLTPEGSPGIMSVKMREFLGDEGYEKVIAQNDLAISLKLTKELLINKILAAVFTLVVIYGIVGLAALAVLAISFATR